jgi:hypothetical protein
MRVLRGFVALALGLALVAVGAPNALASETHHGTFTSATGINDGGGRTQIPEGTYDLDVSGPWNLNIGANGVQVGGYLRITARGQHCDAPDQLAPCPFQLNLEWGTPWVETSPGVFTTRIAFAVTFDLTLRLLSNGDVTLDLVITDCPYGWTSWAVQGTASRS